MSILRAIWLPGLAMIAALLVVVFAGSYVFERQLTGEISDHWLLSAFWSRALMLTIVCTAAAWSGHRLSLTPVRWFTAATVGLLLPIVAVTFFVILSWINTGHSNLDELGKSTTIVHLGVAMLAAAISSSLAQAWSSRRKA